MGSRNARRLRAEGRIPASIQGGDGENLNISVNAHELWSLRRHHVHLFDLEIEGDVQAVTIRELQWDALGEDLNHVEFHRVQRGVKTEVAVSLEFVGHPSGGVLNHLVGEIEVLCLPSLIPDSFEVRVDGFEVGHTITAGSIELPEGFELSTPADLQVAVVAETRSHEVEAEPEEGEEPEGSEEAVSAPEPEPE
jgi:large subunit ribosomal protein L25